MTRKAKKPIRIPRWAIFRSPMRFTKRLTTTPWTKIKVPPINKNISPKSLGLKENLSAGKNEVDLLLFSAGRVSEKPTLSQSKFRIAREKLMVAAAEKGCIPKKTNSEADQSH